MLNYGYSIIRSTIIRALVSCGFYPAFGIHHNNQYNMFNLADDLIEPYRSIVDYNVHHLKSNNPILSKEERKQITSILSLACCIDETKMNVFDSITIMCESLKNAYLNDDPSLLKLPSILPKEELSGIKE